jgi:diguanylate cyclase (GGDEF)-like protein
LVTPRSISRRLARRLAPFAGVAVLALTLAATSPGTNLGLLAAAALLTAAVTAGIVLTPWHRLPEIAHLTTPLAYLVAIAFMHEAVPRTESGPGILVLLPVVYSALYLRRAIVLVVALGGTAVFVVPVLAGSSPQPTGDWHTGVVFGAVALVVGLTVHELVGRISRLAATDPLTALPNRREWDRLVETALGSAAPFCLATLDLDNFKAINDSGGHEFGDAVLRTASGAWRALLGPGDALARLGGDEFGVLLTGGDDPAARVEHLRAATPLGVTCSAGWAVREPGDDAGRLMRRADRALYAAKEAGRDRAVAAA